jgi:hypothetical protein
MSKIRIKEELWDQVDLCFSEPKIAAYKMAVIEADKVLNNLLTLKGISGTTTEERALNVKERFSDVGGLMKAFVIKEKVLEHLNYNLTSVEVNDALESYKKAILDIDSKGKSIPLKQRVKLYFEYYIPKELKKLRNVALSAVGFLAFILFLADTSIGQEVDQFFVGIAEFFYFKIVKVLLISGAVLGLVFISFMFFESKRK